MMISFDRLLLEKNKVFHNLPIEITYRIYLILESFTNIGPFAHELV